jgi:hypothetical protein
MTRGIASTERPYTAMTVVSAMMLGGESKDQDRARWFEPGLTACVADGVTSSFNATEAAELVVSLCPVLFGGEAGHRLDLASALLMARRQECQNSEPTVAATDMPETMRQMLCDIVRSNRETAFQTTLVAAQFACECKDVVARVLRCGDSAFFACLPDGDLLTSSLSATPGPQQGGAPDRKIPALSTAKPMSFGPGDEILVHVEGRLSRYMTLAEKAGVRPKHVHNWLVCSPVHSSPRDDKPRRHSRAGPQALMLGPADRLLVPRFLYGTLLTSRGQLYQVLRYSSTIRLILSSEAPRPATGLGRHGSATAVLPDHYYCGAYQWSQDRFPRGTHFILCSDGFYSGFSDWPELWAWLQENAADLRDDAGRQRVLEQLHRQLHAKGGDDDISFVWVQPNHTQNGRN